MRFSRQPVDGPITGTFGANYGGYAHRGVDFGVPVGTLVYAPADGISVDFTNDGSFGMGVCLHHLNTGWYSLYAHLSSKLVLIGQQVRAGDIIGSSGNTGTSTGPHLHWQVCRSSFFPTDLSQSADPLSFMHPEDEPMTPQEREEFEAMKRVLCEWGQPGRLRQLDVQGIDVYQSMVNQNLALEQMKVAMRAAGMAI